ncbi:MAG: folate family ECF transporter S component [Clostridia bacterium]|nr:folate family ECF transporter S component [Clostridia bacterium]
MIGSHEVLIFTLKIALIAIFALFIGRKTGMFSLGKTASLIILAIVFILGGAELYCTFFRTDISLTASFRSSFYSADYDLSLFLRVFFITIFLSMLCCVCNVKLSFKMHSARDLCALALMIAITVLLGIYATFRIGSGIKVSLKFIPVFITAALFGPVWGGFVAALADIVSFVVNPVGGMFIPQITMVEFLYGFTFGLFFFNMQSWKGFKTVLTVFACVILQIAFLNLTLTTYFLMPLMKMSFNNLFIMRSPAALINLSLRLVIITIMCKYIASFRRALK